MKGFYFFLKKFYKKGSAFSFFDGLPYWEREFRNTVICKFFKKKVPLFHFLPDYYIGNENSAIRLSGRAMNMKSKRRRRMRKMASERVLMDGYGQEYHIVEKRLPGRRKSVYDTYVVRQKRTGRDYLVEIMLQWLIRLIAGLLPVGDW